MPGARFVGVHSAGGRQKSFEAACVAGTSSLYCGSLGKCRQNPADGEAIAPHMVAARPVRHPESMRGADAVKTVNYERMLFYYDEPQVFEARDAIGGHYVAVAISPEPRFGMAGPHDESARRFLVAGVAPELLRQFRAGAIDLRSLLIGSDENERYVSTTENSIEDALALERLTTPLDESGHLPDEGFLLHDDASEGVLREARERNNLIMEIIAEPPEAAVQHRIRAATLAGLLHHVQAMTRNAFHKARRDHGGRNHAPTTALLDVVVPAAPGSFRMMLEAAEIPDLFGKSSLEIALPQVDALFEVSGNPNETLALVRDNRGHFAGSYLHLLRFLADHRTGLRYSWAAPHSETPTKRVILERETRPLIEALTSVEMLATEEISLEGEFEKFNRSTGLWGLMTQDGPFSGKISDEGPSLDGLEVGGSYKFYCDEEIEESLLTGREKRTLYLKRHERM